jgi:hypothetical protein
MWWMIRCVMSERVKDVVENLIIFYEIMWIELSNIVKNDGIKLIKGMEVSLIKKWWRKGKIGKEMWN